MEVGNQCGIQNIVYFFGPGCSTVCTIVVETCNAIATHLLPVYVQIPRGEKLKEIVKGFEDIWRFP